MDDKRFGNNTAIILMLKKLLSLEHSVRALNHTSKTAQIILARTLDWTQLHSRQKLFVIHVSSTADINHHIGYKNTESQCLSVFQYLFIHTMSSSVLKRLVHTILTCAIILVSPTILLLVLVHLKKNKFQFIFNLVLVRKIISVLVLVSVH